MTGTRRLVIQLGKAHECPWHEQRGKGPDTKRYCAHPVHPVDTCDAPSIEPPHDCPLRAAPVVIEVK